MDTDWRFAGLRFLDVRDLRGSTVVEADGTSLGSVSAVLPRLDGAVDVLVAEDTPRGRVFRVALDRSRSMSWAGCGDAPNGAPTGSRSRCRPSR